MSGTPDSTLADLQQIIADLQSQLVESRAERDEALERQTATAEVLEVINASPGDLKPVFEAMLEKAMRLCGAAFGILRGYDGHRFHTSAAQGVPPAYAEFLIRNPQEPEPGTSGFRVLETRSVVHIADAMADEVYRAGET